MIWASGAFPPRIGLVGFTCDVQRTVRLPGEEGGLEEEGGAFELVAIAWRALACRDLALPTIACQPNSSPTHVDARRAAQHRTCITLGIQAEVHKTKEASAVIFGESLWGPEQPRSFLRAKAPAHKETTTSKPLWCDFSWAFGVGRCVSER